MLPQSVLDRITYNQNAMLQTLSDLISIPSVATSIPQDGYPYGRPCAEALEYMLDALQGIGLDCHNMAYQVGTADWDKTLPPHLGILCHLDVVPATKTNWSSPPFQATIRDGRIYGRGAIDDKGPAVAVLYALRAIRESGISLQKNIQFLLGCNEENGSTDLEYYKQHTKLPPYVFTPDGSYPLIHLEKGMLRITFSKQTTDPIIYFQSGTAPNAVPAKAYAKTKIPIEIKNTIPEKFQQCGTEYTYKGIAAHASTPESGDNAITGLLSHFAQSETFPDCTALSKLFPHNCIDGRGLGINCSDAISGTLTCVCSMLKMENNMIEGCIDIRFPICTTKEELLQKIKKAFSAYGFYCQVQIGSDPHYTPEDSPFIQTLLKVYEEQTGNPGTCIAIGGGTYVHDIPGGVAFGMEYPEWDYHMHGDDEFIPIDQLMENTKMMAAAILRMCR